MQRRLPTYPRRPRWSQHRTKPHLWKEGARTQPKYAQKKSVRHATTPCATRDALPRAHLSTKQTQFVHQTDATSQTGWRVDLKGMPLLRGGIPLRPRFLNELDGFSTSKSYYGYLNKGIIIISIISVQYQSDCTSYI